MNRLDTPDMLRRACDVARAYSKRVALVPTMGALHAGHMALVHHARDHADFVIVSVFVNPTQFGPGEDLDRYPRMLELDAARCREAGVDALFVPQPGAMYPAGEQTRVRLEAMSAGLCGVERPTHFEGVATIVTKLLNLTGPCLAVFGRKDYQQLRIIDRLVTDLLLPVEVAGVPIVREADGLALSSRNRYLSEQDRVRALALSRGLSSAHGAFTAGERSVAKLRGLVTEQLQAAVDRIDYVTLADADSVEPLADDAQSGERALLAVAAHVGVTRLIDNVVLGEDPAPTAAAGA